MTFSKYIQEKAPPSEEMEKWIKEMKPKFQKQYGKRWEEVLYALAWKKYKENEK